MEKENQVNDGPKSRKARDTTFKWGKVYYDDLKSHAWEIIKGMKKPTFQYCRALYDVIFTESIKGEGELTYSPTRPYRPIELLQMAGLGKEEMYCWKLLKDKNLIKTLPNGTIEIVGKEERFGHETYWARNKRINRIKDKECNDSKSLDTSGTSIGLCPTDGNSSPHPNSIESKSRKSSKKDNTNVVPPLASSTADGDNDVDEKLLSRITEFESEYPKKSCHKQVIDWFKKNNLNNRTFGALMIALGRRTGSLNWRKEKGRYVPLPQNWLARHEWSEEDASDWERRQYEAEMNAEAESESDDEPASAHQLPIPPAKQIEKGKQP